MDEFDPEAWIAERTGGGLPVTESFAPPPEPVAADVGANTNLDPAQFSGLPDYTTAYARRLVDQYGGRTEQWADRDIRGRPGVRSKHATGEAIDYYNAPVAMRMLADQLAQSGDVGRVIYNRRIWEPDSGWRAYGGVHPHDDHIHIEPTLRSRPSQGEADAPTPTVPQEFTAAGTNYMPASSAAIEGGPLGAGSWHGATLPKQEPLYTLDQFRRGEAPHVSVAMDNGATNPLPYGAVLNSPDFPGVPFRVMDTGGAFNGSKPQYGGPKGLTRIDIARDLANAQDPETNRQIRFTYGAPASAPSTEPWQGDPGPAIGEDTGAASTFGAFDPEAFIRERESQPAPAQSFDPDKFIAARGRPGFGDLHVAEKMPLTASPEIEAEGERGIQQGLGMLDYLNQVQGFGDAAQRAAPEPQNPFSPGRESREGAFDSERFGGSETPWEALNTPYFEIPKPEGTGIGAGIARGALGMAEGLETPFNLALVAGMGGLPGLAQKGVASLFGAQMLKGAGEELGHGFSADTPGDAAEHYTRALLGGALGSAAAGHAGGRTAADISTRPVRYHEFNRSVDVPLAEPIEAGSPTARGAPYSATPGVHDRVNLNDIEQRIVETRMASEAERNPERERQMREGTFISPFATSDANHAAEEVARWTKPVPTEPLATSPSEEVKTAVPAAPNENPTIQPTAPVAPPENTPAPTEPAARVTPPVGASTVSEHVHVASGALHPDDAPIFDKAERVVKGITNEFEFSDFPDGLKIEPKKRPTATGAEGLFYRGEGKISLQFRNKDGKQWWKRPIDEERIKGTLTHELAHALSGKTEGAENRAAMERLRPAVDRLWNETSPEPKVPPMEAPPSAPASPENVTSIKNAQTDIDRSAMALRPAGEPVRRPWTQVEQEARATDRGETDRLIAELNSAARTVSDRESAQLALRWSEEKAGLSAANDAVIAAREAGDEAAVARAMEDRTAREERLQSLADTLQAVGTKAGQSLAARKMFNASDWSEDWVVKNTRAKLGGRQLTPEEYDAARGVAAMLAKNQAELDAGMARVKETGETTASAEAHQELTKEVAAEEVARQKAPRQPGRLKRLASKAEEFEQAALARIREREQGQRLQSGLGDPGDIQDAAIVLAARIVKGAVKASEVAAHLTKEFGEWVKPHVGTILTAAKAKVLEWEKAADNPSPQEIAGKIRSRIEDGAELKDLRPYVRELAKAQIRAGVTEREPLIDAVHAEVEKLIPGTTRSQTRDLISGYGDFKPLSKDAIVVKLRELSGEMQQLGKLEDMANGIAPKKSGVERRTPTEEERQLIKAVNEAKKAGGYALSNAQNALKTYLQTQKTRVGNQIKDLHDRIARGDYEKRARKAPPTPDAELQRLQAERVKIMLDYNRGVERTRLAQRPTSHKIIEAIPKWQRAFVLSGVRTLAKLTSAATELIAFAPLEEAAGGVIGKVLPSIAKRAPRQGGFSLSAEGNAFVGMISNLMKDVGSELHHGHTDIDLLYGKPRIAPPELKDFIGQVHGALKVPVRRNEFIRSLAKRTAFAEKKGIDTSDPIIQTQLATAAYKDANAAIFLEDNRAIKAYKAALATLVAKDKATGHPNTLGVAARAAAEFTFPVVKIPTNIVWRALEYSPLGLARGGGRIIGAMRRGFDALTEEQADAIMKNLKRGSIGSALMLYGYFQPEQVGGYYQHGEKRRPDQAQAGGLRLFGTNIPRFLIHNPLLEQLQIGATIRRVADSKLHKSDRENQGLMMGIGQALLGLAEEVPFVGTTIRKARAVDQPSKLVGETVKSAAVPQAVSQTAEYLDPAKPRRTAMDYLTGETTKRSPKTVGDYLKTGVPYLRKEVPRKK